MREPSPAKTIGIWKFVGLDFCMEIRQLKFGVQIPYPQQEVTTPNREEVSGHDGVAAIDEKVAKNDELIDYEDVVRRGLIMEEVGEGIRMKYKNLLAASIPPEPHYLKHTETYSRKIKNSCLLLCS